MARAGGAGGGGGDFLEFLADFERDILRLTREARPRAAPAEPAAAPPAEQAAALGAGLATAVA